MDDAAMADAAGGEDAAPQPLSSPNLLLTLQSAQAQHGLRHGDYARYRQYCARRLRRLYKMLGFTHGGVKNRFQPRPLTPSDVTDGRHFLIPLVCAERAWAHAMELKAASRGENARKRHHAIKRLSKAAAWAAQLASLAAARSDARTALEAEAYASWMAGNVLLERETDWGAALSRFSRAQAAFEQLAKVGPPDAAAAARARLAELEPALRFCRYKGGAMSAGDLSAMDADSPAAGLLAPKLEALAAAERARAGGAGGGGVGGGAGAAEVSFRGRPLVVPSAGARAALAEAVALGAQLDAAADAAAAAAAGATGAAAAPQSQERRLALYDKLLLALSDAAASIRADAAAAGGAEPAAAQLRSADAAVAVLTLRRTADRNRLLLAGVAARWVRTLAADAAPGAAAAAAGSGGSRRGGERSAPARIQDVVRLYDTLLGNAAELADVAADGGRFGSGAAAAADAAAVAAEAAAEGATLRAERATSLGRWHAACGRHAEAAALYGRAAEHAARGADAAAGLPPPEGPRLAAAAAAARDAARRERCLAVVAAAGAAAAARGAVTDAVAAVTLDDAGAPAAASAPEDDLPPSQRYALESLELYAPAAGAGVRPADVRLFPIPPPMASVPARPLFLDTALTALPLPSVAHRARPAGGSRLGRLTSGLGLSGGVSGAVSSLLGSWRGSGAKDKS